MGSAWAYIVSHRDAWGQADYHAISETGTRLLFIDAQASTSRMCPYCESCMLELEGTLGTTGAPGSKRICSEHAAVSKHTAA